jgi:N-acetylmuramoyl-L-alanine amidase
MFKKNKKAAINEQTYMLIINIVIIVIVWGLVFNYVRSVGNNTLVEKIYLSKDIALLTNIISSSPGNIFYTYSNSSNKLDITKYLYSFKDSYVKVKENEKANQVYFPYAKDLSFENSFPNLIENPEEIHFVKTGNKLSIDKSLTSNLNQISCPDIKIEEELANQNILLDPGHGKDPNRDIAPDDFGLEFKDYYRKNKKEAYITTQISNGVKTNYINNNKVKQTRNYDTPLSIQTRKDSAKDAHIIISIHIGNYSNSHNTIKAFIPYKTTKFLQSRKLACSILNSFPPELELDGIVIIPVDTSTLQKDNPMQIINFEDKTAVLLEIGNINTEQGRSMFNQPSKLSDSIYTGLTKYYSK